MLKVSLKLSLETPKMRLILQFYNFLIFFFNFFWERGRQKGILHIIKKKSRDGAVSDTSPSTT